MKTSRVKRSHGPKSVMTENTYRKKALPFLLKDFEKKCAYCLDPNDFRIPSHDQVDHFNCKLRGRNRHYYKNLMLGCAACNHSKHDKPLVNPFDTEQRLLNCTEENEFIGHIKEEADGQWVALSKAGEYHLESIGLTVDCHRKKRQERRKMIERIVSLFTTAVHYRTENPEAVHNELMATIRMLMDTLDKFPPLVIGNGVFTARDWLKSKGVDLSLI
jgi:hypothetical protein